MSTLNVELSILIITHNQLSLLKRCLKSVLVQKINVPFEIIVSDDRSTDGTLEYMTLLSKNDNVKNIPNLIEIVYTRCNSNDCNPANVSDRCGWNKLNAYKHASGTYFVNIDADDYLRSDDIYQRQLDMLVTHPECSMCMQDVWQIRDGEDIAKGYRWPSFNKLNDGQILSAKDIVFHYRALNQCYMIRRHPEFDVANYYGRYFDDTIITFHHLQYGSCVWIDRADYVWVKYKYSITGTLEADDELVTCSLLPLHHIRFIPKFAGLFMQEAIPSFVHFYKALCNKSFRLNLSERSLVECSRNNGFIYERLCNGFSHCDKFKIYFIRIILLFMNKFHFTSSFLLRYIYTLNAYSNTELLTKCDWDIR